jgi:hypothetical protein
LGKHSLYEYAELRRVVEPFLVPRNDGNIDAFGGKLRRGCFANAEAAAGD